VMKCQLQVMLLAPLNISRIGRLGVQILAGRLSVPYPSL